MKANELRIGNYVKGVSDNYTDRENKLGEYIFPVAVIGKDFVKLDIGFDALESYENRPIISYLLSDLKPIPLTEEWLLKFGFELDYESHWSSTQEFLLLEQLGDSYIKLCDGHFHDSIEMKFVHQLQNLYFALTGEELKIKE